MTTGMTSSLTEVNLFLKSESFDSGNELKQNIFGIFLGQR